VHAHFAWVIYPCAVWVACAEMMAGAAAPLASDEEPQPVADLAQNG